jgi:hypothetical protein
MTIEFFRMHVTLEEWKAVNKKMLCPFVTGFSLKETDEMLLYKINTETHFQ